VFEEHPANFLVVPINVVRPLDSETFAVVRQSLHHGKRKHLGERKLLLRLEEMRVAKEAEKQVIATRGFPSCAALPATSSLKVGSE